MSSSEWQQYLKEYNEQRRLEEYQSTRVLVRPKTTITTIIFHISLLFLIVVVGIIGLAFVLSLKIWMKFLIIFFYSILVFETYGRFLAIKMVECYQHHASEEKRRSCKCIPSCSEYAILCLKKYELLYALFKIRKRLFVTCKGFDYIIDNP